MENFNESQVKLLELMKRLRKCQSIYVNYGHKWASEEEIKTVGIISDIIKTLSEKESADVLNYFESHHCH